MNQNSEQNIPEKREFSMSEEMFDWAQSLVFSVVVIVLVFTFFVRIIGVEGGSMEDTLHQNDRIAITNLFYTPQKGDVVVMRKDSFMQEPIVKRIIATEGDTIDINFETRQVFVNGEELREDYIRELTERQGSTQFPAVVPEGHIFVMGDNRNHSTDSRWQELGMVDERYILGKVLFRVFPFTKIGPIG